MKSPVKKEYITQGFGENLIALSSPVFSSHCECIQLFLVRFVTSITSPHLFHDTGVFIDNMFTMTRTKLQISKRIIKSITIYVVDNFKLFQESAKVFFHHKSMKSNVTLFSTIWVIPSFNVIITRANNLSYVLRMVFRILINFLKRISNFLFSFFRPFLSEPVLVHVGNNNPSVTLCQ